jgi:hypothetical protein
MLLCFKPSQHINAAHHQHQPFIAAAIAIQGAMMSPALHPAVSATPFFPSFRITAPRDHRRDLLIASENKGKTLW